MSEWKITDDSGATYAAKKIAEAKAELEKMLAWYEMQAQKAKDEAQETIDFFTAALEEYFQTVPKRTTKTGIQKYAFPGGELVMKPASIEYERDEAQLLAWLKEQELFDLIAVTEKPMWADIKKRINETGELPDGVTPVEKPESFTVKEA